VKLPRDLSGQRVVHALKRLGFIEERQEGSHIRLVRGSLRVTVPAHRALAPKTL
jgi:predicted RNA binding protein YcfA (HicA-like mRNA interferase family)